MILFEPLDISLWNLSLIKYFTFRYFQLNSEQMLHMFQIVCGRERDSCIFEVLEAFEVFEVLEDTSINFQIHADSL